jgi:hypothetical protein
MIAGAIEVTLAFAAVATATAAAWRSTWSP